MENIQVTKKRSFDATFTDSFGLPAHIQGSVSVSVSPNGAVEELADKLDGQGRTVGATGFLRVTAIGAGQLQITGDADRGDGVREITLLAEYNGIEGEAVGGTIILGGADLD